MIRICISVALLFLFSTGAAAICDRSDFDNQFYVLDVAPLDPIANVATAGRMTFVLKFHRTGILAPRGYIYGYDTYEGSSGISVYLGNANKAKTRLFAKKFNRSCYITLNMEGLSPVNSYAWDIAASGYASLASVADGEAPDFVSLHNALVTYGGAASWANVTLTRVQ